MAQDEYSRILKRVDERVSKMPEFVKEYVSYRIDASPNTLDGYTRDYEGFFEWLKENQYFNEEIKDMSIHVLENLRAIDIKKYERHCLVERRNKIDTVARKLASLKSLFHYLSQIAEDEEMYPYLHRNIMAKMDIRKERVSEAKRAELISQGILVEDEFTLFREFVAEGYAKQLEMTASKRMLNAHLRNRARDLAMISLLLGSGLRISECLSIDMDEIDWKNQQATVTRKGNSGDIASFSDTAARDIKAYLEVREEIYKPKGNVKALFLSGRTGRGGVSQRLTVRAAQKMFEKYAEAFGKGKITLHKLRHSFATRHYKENKDIALLKKILNHENVDTTMIYTHVFDKQIKDSINRTDK